MRSTKHLVALGAAVLAFAACDDTGVVTPGGSAEFTVVMASDGSTPASSLALALVDAGDPLAGVIGLDVVESIFLPIGEVEALPAGGGEGWVSAGSVGETVDLLNLPEGGLTLIESTLPQGEYTAFRFWLTGDPTIVLSSEVKVGRQVYEVGEHTLDIPSADKAGVRLLANFVVDADGQTLAVLVDGGATVKKIIATGSGSLKMTPVLRVQNDDGDDVGEVEDGEDDDGEGDDDEGEDDTETVEVEGAITGVNADAQSFTIDFEEREVTVVLDADTDITFGEGLESWQDVVDAVGADATILAEAEGEWAETDRLLATAVTFEVEASED